jgi:hypothetical protein
MRAPPNFSFPGKNFATTRGAMPLPSLADAGRLAVFGSPHQHLASEFSQAVRVVNGQPDRPGTAGGARQL